LAGFQVGIGICHGSSIAGKIGTSEQAKVGVFGPVVNLASRLESLTKQVGVSILVDEEVASQARKHLTPDEARCRRIARVRPFGIDSAFSISELLPPASELPSVTDSQLVAYEEALKLFNKGRWREAQASLDSVPEDDGAKAFLLAFLTEHEWQPPEGWDGTITLHEK
jgi:adenylate cyclase